MNNKWKCNVEDFEGTPCGNKAIVKAGRGKTAKYFCKKHELIVVDMMLSGVI